MSYCWSKSRFRLFSNCRREYFLHFVASGGWSDDATLQIKEISRLKNLTYPNWYVLDLLRKSLHKLVDQEERDESLQVSLSREVWREWGRDFSTQSCEFAEVYYGEITLQTAVNLTESTLKNLLKIFRYSPLATKLNCEFQAQRIPLPLQFNIGDITVYTTPFALFLDEKGYEFWQLSGSNDTLDAVLQQYYMFSTHGVEPGRVRSRFYHVHTGEVSSYSLAELNFSETLELISEQSEQIAEIPHEFFEKNAYFAISQAEKARCLQCRFRAICL